MTEEAGTEGATSVDTTSLVASVIDSEVGITEGVDTSVGTTSVDTAFVTDVLVGCCVAFGVRVGGGGMVGELVEVGEGSLLVAVAEGVWIASSDTTTSVAELACATTGSVALAASSATTSVAELTCGTTGSAAF